MQRYLILRRREDAVGREPVRRIRQYVVDPNLGEFGGFYLTEDDCPFSPRKKRKLTLAEWANYLAHIRQWTALKLDDGEQSAAEIPADGTLRAVEDVPEVQAPPAEEADPLEKEIDAMVSRNTRPELLDLASELVAQGHPQFDDTMTKRDLAGYILSNKE